jgi:hypothetical protein
MIWSLDTSLVLIYTVPRPWFTTVQRKLQRPDSSAMALTIPGNSGAM